MLKATKNAMAVAGVSMEVRNHPGQYKDRQHRYFERETALFTEETAKYASDVYEAEVQGLDPEDRFAWYTTLLRVSDLIRPTAAIARNFDDFKMVMFVSRKIDYLRRGSKVKLGGSVWLAINPQNLSGRGNSVIRRCNATWNRLDYYGNLWKEPVVVDSELVKASSPDAQEFVNITKGYLNVTCQYNPWTAEVDTNTRLMLGRDVYSVTGPCDFLEEFTGDENSVSLIQFSVRYEEYNDALDDRELRVAGGKTFQWSLSLQGPASLAVGQTAQFIGNSVRNGVAVEGTEEHPVTYLWKSENPGVIQVDEFGLVTAIVEGEGVLTCSLLQNEDISSSVTIRVESGGERLVFLQHPPERLKAYQSVTLSAALLENGQDSGREIQWFFHGERGTYTVIQDGNQVTVKCWKGSEQPLVVRAVCYGYALEHEIKLAGI